MTLINEFDITDRKKIRLQVSKYCGKEIIDIREYIKVDDEFIFTQKGIYFSSEWVDKFITMIDKLRDI